MISTTEYHLLLALQDRHAPKDALEVAEPSIALAVEHFNEVARSARVRKQIIDWGIEDNALKVVLEAARPLEQPSRSLKTFTNELARESSLKQYVQAGSLFRSLRPASAVCYGADLLPDMDDSELISLLVRAAIRRDPEDVRLINAVRSAVYSMQ